MPSRPRLSTVLLLPGALLLAAPLAPLSGAVAGDGPPPPDTPQDSPGHLSAATDTLSEPRPALPELSLEEWADRGWLHLADRSAATAGGFSRDGLLLRFHESFDAEYELDFISSRFSLWEDGAWTKRDNGFRYWSGSINHLLMTDGAQVKVRAPLGERWSFSARYDRETNPALDRDLLRVRVGYGGSTGYHAFAGASLQAVKPDRDLVLGGGWRGPRASWRMELHALDGFSNLIFNGIGVFRGFSPLAVDYSRPPLGLRGSVDLRPFPALRLAAVGGVLLPTELSVYDQEDREAGFTQEETFQQGGIMAEVTPSPGVRIGAVATLLRAHRDRTPLERGEAEDDFEHTESTVETGLFVHARLQDAVHLQGWLARSWRPDERVRRDPVAEGVDYLDRAWSGLVTLGYTHARGPMVNLGWEFDFRDVVRGDGQVPREESLDRNNHRLRVEGGWSMGDRFQLLVGFRLDTDGDRYLDRGPFDGGHGRVVIHW